MGWTYSHKPQGQTAKQFILEQWNREPRYQVVDSHFTLRVGYLALKYLETNEVFACVVLMNHVPKDYHNFGHKEISEEMGPYNYDCPNRILDLLSPTDNQYAQEWRDECRRRNSKPKAKHGDHIRLDRELKFTNGDRCQEFIVLKEGRKVRFKNARTGTKYQITGFSRMNYQILEMA